MVEKTLRVALVATVLFGIFAVPVFAAVQDGKPVQEGETAEGEEQVAPAVPPKETYWNPLVALGAGLTTLGGAFGIGKLAAAAMEGTARQPEAGGDIRTSMIIAAALIEGFTFFALVVCLLIVL
jgi:F-type H+-transporting ATPase subunit c